MVIFITSGNLSSLARPMCSLCVMSSSSAGSGGTTWGSSFELVEESMSCSRSTSTDTLSEPSDSEQLSGVDCDLFELYQSFEYEDDASTSFSETWESQPHGGTCGHTVFHEAPLYLDNVFSESVKPAPAGIEF